MWRIWFFRSSGDDSHLPFGTCYFGFASFNFASHSRTHATCSPHFLSIALITFRKALHWRCIQLTESVTQLQFNGEIALMKWILFSTRERQPWRVRCVDVRIFAVHILNAVKFQWISMRIFLSVSRFFLIGLRWNFTIHFPPNGRIGKYGDTRRVQCKADGVASDETIIINIAMVMVYLKLPSLVCVVVI